MSQYVRGAILGVGLRLLVLWSVSGCALALAADSTDSAQDEEAAAQHREQQVAERFRTVLERNPRRGTALDRVYGHHVQWGSLDAFVQRYRERTKAEPREATAWMVLGLVESQRGRDAAAVDAFQQAEQLLPDNAIAAYYLGQSLVLVGRTDDAVAAMERALTRKPAQSDLLEIFQSLGRIHQRAQRTEQALAVWSRLEQLFPGDLTVQERIAATLVEENQCAAALPRYEALARRTEDAYRRSVFQMEVAELKVRLKRFAEGLADLEKLLAGLNPDSWLYREVRRKIDDIFLRGGDQDGLAKYYETWLQKHPRDTDAMARLARVLARQARVPEARRWLEKSLELAPSQRQLRLAFIDQLVDDQRWADAVEQYQLLDKADPNNPDYLREWGKLILRDAARPKPERQAAAEQVWRRLAAARPQDALAATQVADLFRFAEMPDPALEHYRKAVELAPTEPQYREYLGEYLHLLKRPDEALATWREMAAGPQRTAANLARLAEVLAGFGYQDQALGEIAAATKLDAKDFALHIQAARLHTRGGKHDEALAFLKAAEGLAANDDERESVLAQRIEALRSQETLAQQAEALEAELAKATAATARQWLVLARYQEELRQHPQATQAIRRAQELESNSIPVAKTAARIAEQAGDLAGAATAFRRLTVLDRRSQSDSWRAICRLESQLGRRTEALAAGRELLAAAPGNAENYEFFATLCFQTGAEEEGIQALRRALRMNPTEPQLAMTLAAALAGQFRTDEAIELYWQAFERAGDLDGKLSVIERLTELYLQLNRFDRLLERLQRERADADRRRELTICLSQAYHAAGDFGQARQELESLLSEDTRDTQLLQQVSKLADEEGDLEAAVRYQEQLVRVAPGAETEYRLADLYNRVGRETEASSILVRLTTREQDPTKLLRNIDSLIGSQQQEAALRVLEAALHADPANWELRYRQGLALAGLKDPEASRSFQAILDLDGEDSQMSEAFKQLQQQQQRQVARAAGRTPPNIAALVARRTQRWYLLQGSYDIRQAVGLDRDYYDPYGGQRRRTLWAPSFFGQARMAALAWLLKLRESTDEREAFVARYRQAAERDPSSPRAVWDWLYLSRLQASPEDTVGLHRLARRLAEAGDADGQWAYLLLLGERTGDRRTSSRSPGGAAADSTPPLADDELRAMLQAYRAIVGRGGQNGADMVPLMGNFLVPVVATELRRAKREDEARQLADEIEAAARSSAEFLQLASLAAAREDWPAAIRLLKRGSQAAGEQPQGNISGYTFAQWMGRRGADKAHADVLQMLDIYLDARIAQAQSERTPATTRTRSMASSTGTGPAYVQFWYGQQAQQVQLAFPTLNRHVDQMTLTVLRTGFEVFQRNDVLSDLVAHFQQRRERAAAGDKFFSDLHLSVLYWWDEQREPAVRHLLAASNALPQDVALRLQAAQALVLQEDHEEALKLVDGFSPQDHDALRQRETLALNLAARLGDTARARQAAERLFGLRLSADEQLALAAQMRSLSMNEHVDALLARVQRQAGNQLGALVTLMNQCLTQGDREVALQIAQRLLQRTSGTPAAGRGRTQPVAYASGQSSGDASAARQAALQCLAQTGALKDLTARAEEQFAKTPASTRAVQRLAELYEAGGQSDKALQLQGKLVEQRAQDGELRYRYAQQLAGAGKLDDACQHYLVAIKAEPRLLQRDAWQVLQTFQRAKKSTELVRLLKDIDLRALGQYWSIGDVISNLAQNKEQVPLAVELLQRAWQAFPEQRSELFSRISNEEVLQHPGVYEMGREALVPGVATSQRDPWVGLRVSGYYPRGEIRGMLTWLLRAAGSAERIGQLHGDVAAALPQRPQWLGGRALLALLDLRQGRVAEAQTALEALLPDDVAKAAPGDALRIIAQELETHPPSRELAVRLYETSLLDRNRGPDEFEYSAGPRLVKLYTDTGRREQARQMLLDATKPTASRYGDPEYEIYRRIQSLNQVAQLLATLEFPVDALRVYREILITQESPEARNSRYSSSYQREVPQMHERVQRLMETIDERQLTELTNRLLAPPLGRENQTPLDLMLVITSPANEPPRIESLLFNVLGAAVKRGEAVAAVRRRLAELTEKHPQDLVVQVANCVFTLRTEKGEPARNAVERLVAAMEAVPLETLAPGQRANARQRKDAEAQIPLWLAARECLAREELRDPGRLLAERAAAAARRQQDPRYLLAILQVWGQTALEAGDLARADKVYRAMFDHALGRTTDGRRPAASDAGRVAPITQSQFREAMKIAQTTADKLPDVSLAAAVSALEGGPPVPDAAPTTARAQPVPVRSSASEGDPNAALVATLLPAVITAWQRNAVAPDRLYETLVAIVFCRGRPDEILLYPQPLRITLARARNAAADSLAQILAEAAVKSGRVDDLQQRVAARNSQPAAAFAGRVLLAAVALARQEAAALNEHLAALSEQIKTRPSSLHLELLCPVGLAATRRHPELVSTTVPLLDLIANSPAARQSGSGEDGTLSLLIAQNHIDAQRFDAARPHLEKHLQTRAQIYSRSGGDYGPYMQQRDTAELANLMARRGQVPMCLDFLGRYADMTPTSHGEPDVTPVLWHLARHVVAMPPETAYELLRDWTLPTDTRRSVRMVAAFNPGRMLPEEFVREQQRRFGQPEEIQVPARLQQGFGSISNLGLLIESAAAAGQLEELTKRAAQLAADKVLRAESLHVLCCIAAGDRTQGERRIRASLADISKRRRGDGVPETEKRPQWRDYLVVEACLRSREFADLGRALADEMLPFSRWSHHNSFILHLGYEMAMSGLRPLPETHQDVARQTGLALWRLGTPPLATRGDMPPAWWCAHEGQVLHVTGLENDRLYFRWPLSGRFEFSVDMTSEHFGTGELGYGGLACEPMPWDNRVAIWPTSWHESLSLPRAVEAFPGFHRRLSVDVRPEAVRFLVNGHLVYEERQPSPTSPWLHLICLNHRQTAFRNPRLTGQPSIPREVPLSHADRLDGWTANRLGHRLPLRLSAGASNRSESNDSRPVQWWSADGVIHGRFLGTRDYGTTQSLLTYDRPLQSGESIEYEFLYERGKTQVHPSLGALTFLLEESGVRLHWTTPPGGAHSPFEVPEDNAIELRGPAAAAKLPLQPNQWNRARVALDERTVRIQLNGQLVAERELEPTNEGKFGLFHFADKTEAQARNLVLRGDWPEQLTADQLQDLFATDAEQVAPEILRARHAIVGEAYLTQNPAEIGLAAKALPPAQAYERLRQWVLPNRLHSTCRLQGGFTPLDSVPLLGTPSSAQAGRPDTALLGGPSSGTQRVSEPRRGGQYVAPAIELVRLARELGRLDELTTGLADVTDTRSAAALRVLIAVAAGDDGSAQQALVELFRWTRQLPPDTPFHERHPEATALAAALERPALVDTALPLAEWLVEYQQGNYVSYPWERTVRGLRGLARWRHDVATATLPVTAPPAMRQWSLVNHVVAKERGLGFPAGPWWFERGEVQHHPGNSLDGLYFRTPLRGNFEIEYEMSTYGWREINLGYAMTAFSLRHDGQAVSRNVIGQGANSINLDRKLEAWGPWVHCRLAVREGTLTWTANGRQVHQEPVALHADPWIFIRTLAPHFDGRVRNLRITGTPTVPERIWLSEGDGLLGWRGDYYEESLSGENADWRKERDEIVGRRVTGADGSFRESILQYHRPLLEDGELTYDFFYQAGKQEVHPVLDRLVFVLFPNGVAGHWLSDGGYERNGLAPDNRFDLPAGEVLKSGPLPFRPDTWNCLKLALAGDVVTITLNGQAIVKHQLEPGNQRHFGLFHYSDATQVRVRNVIHRGDWPKQLPPVEEQELARPAEVAWPFDPQGSQTLTTEMNRPAAELEQRGSLAWGWGDAVARQVTKDGLRVSLLPACQKSNYVGYQLKTPVLGDFEITATVDGVRLDKSSAGAVTVAVGAFLKDPISDSRPALEWTLLRDGTGRLSPTRHARWPDGTPRYINQPQDAPSQVTALRLVRRGSRFHYLYQTDPRSEFRFLDSFDVGRQPVNYFGVYLVALDDNAEATATFRRLSLSTLPTPPN